MKWCPSILREISKFEGQLNSLFFFKKYNNDKNSQPHSIVRVCASNQITDYLTMSRVQKNQDTQGMYSYYEHKYFIGQKIATKQFELHRGGWKVHFQNTELLLTLT
jgi:hypothetical protein